MNILLTAIVLWLSANFELPAAPDHPTIAFASPSVIAALRHDGAAGPPMPTVTTPAGPGRREVVSVYDGATRTIWLPEGWTGRTPAELSIVVHEMVHHLQHLAGQRHECPQQRERLAYKAQGQWLALFGTDLAREFEIDPFTLMVTTNCL